MNARHLLTRAILMLTCAILIFSVGSRCYGQDAANQTAQDSGSSGTASVKAAPAKANNDQALHDLYDLAKGKSNYGCLKPYECKPCCPKPAHTAPPCSKPSGTNPPETKSCPKPPEPKICVAPPPPSVCSPAPPTLTIPLLPEPKPPCHPEPACRPEPPCHPVVCHACRHGALAARLAAIDDLASVAGDPTTAVVYLRDILKEQCCKCHDVDSILIALHAIRALGKLGNTAQSACPELDCAVAISSDLWPAVQDAKKNIFKKPTTKPTQADWQNVAKTVAAVQGDVGTLQTQANKLAQDVQQIVPPPMQGLMTDVNNLVQSTTALTIAVNNLATAINKVIPQQPTPPSE